MRSVLDGIKKIPQPEEAAPRPSRRPQGADPACLCGLRNLRGGLTPDDRAQSHLWVKIRSKPEVPQTGNTAIARPGSRRIMFARVADGRGTLSQVEKPVAVISRLPTRTSVPYNGHAKKSIY